MSSPQGGFRHTWACVALIVLAIAVAYADSLGGPFVLDDHGSIVANRSIRSFSTVLTPPGGGLTVQARPILNLSLAINYAFGGTSVLGYHLTNIVLHMLVALLVFGCLRRLLPDPWVACVGALLWALHPLDTAAVTYVIQRAEVLMALFYLATLYAFLRYANVGQSAERRGGAEWAWLSVTACLLGMGTKEVMVSAPLIVFLVDAVLVSAGPREAFRKRKAYYLGLSATWLLVASLTIASRGRGGTSGLGAPVDPVAYWLTQARAWCLYARLAVWPQPLVFDYGPIWLHRTSLVAWVLVSAVFAATLRGLARRRDWGVALFWSICVLLPTSLVPGGRQVMAEHRMYLSLVPLVWLLGIGICALPRARRLAALAALLAASFVFGSLTALRNVDYSSARALYEHDVRNDSLNPYAYANLATALLAERQYAAAEYYGSLAAEPENGHLDGPPAPAGAEAAGVAELHGGRLAEAISDFQRALAFDPTFASARGDLANALAVQGRTDEAIREAREASLDAPYDEPLKAEYGSILALSGDLKEAEAQLVEARRMEPSDPEAAMNLGLVMDATGRPDQAASLLDEACILDPESAQAAFNLGAHQAQRGDRSGAMGLYVTAIQIDPRYAEARENLGNLLLASSEVDEAIHQYRVAVRIDGKRADFHYNLANGLLHRNDRLEAKAELERALECNRSFEPAKRLLDRLAAAGL